MLSIYRDDIKENVATVALETGRRGTSADRAILHPGDARLFQTTALRRSNMTKRDVGGWTWLEGAWSGSPMRALRVVLRDNDRSATPNPVTTDDELSAAEVRSVSRP